MADNKKYYYFRMTENFFDSDAMVILESMQDGYLYSNILLKLYAKSLKDEGRLMFNERIPYNPTILAKLTRHSVGVVEKSLNIFMDLGLIEVLDNGAIYMLDIQNLIGKSTTEADRKRDYRKRISEERDMGHLSLECPDKSTPEIELYIEKEIDTPNLKIPPTLTDVVLYCEERKNGINAEHFIDYYQARGWMLNKNNKMKDWQAAIRTWEKNNQKNKQQKPKELPILPD